MAWSGQILITGFQAESLRDQEVIQTDLLQAM